MVRTTIARFPGGSGTEPVHRSIVAALGLQGEALDEISASDYAEVKIDDTWMEMPLTEDWTCAMRLTVQDGAVIIAEVRVFPAETWRDRPAGSWSGAWLGSRATVPPGGVTARLLRTVTVSAAQSETTRFLDTLRRQYAGRPADFALVTRWWVGGALRTGQPSHRPRRRPAPSDLFLAEVAQRYVAALETKSRRPIVDVAAQLNITPKDTSRYVFLARRRGLLTATLKRGKRGGRLTARAVRLLKRPSQS